MGTKKGSQRGEIPPLMVKRKETLLPSGRLSKPSSSHSQWTRGEEIRSLAVLGKKSRHRYVRRALERLKETSPGIRLNVASDLLKISGGVQGKTKKKKKKTSMVAGGMGKILAALQRGRGKRY